MTHSSFNVYANPDDQLELAQLIDSADLPAPDQDLEENTDQSKSWYRDGVHIQQRNNEDIVNVSYIRGGINADLVFTHDDILALVSAFVTTNTADHVAWLTEEFAALPFGAALSFDTGDVYGQVLAVKCNKTGKIWSTNTSKGPLNHIDLAEFIMEFGGTYDELGCLNIS